MKLFRTAVLIVHMGTYMYNMTFCISLLCGCVYVHDSQGFPGFSVDMLHISSVDRERIFIWLMFLFSRLLQEKKKKMEKTDIDVVSGMIKRLIFAGVCVWCVCASVHRWACRVFISSVKLPQAEMTVWLNRWLLLAGSLSWQLVGSDVSQSSQSVLYYIDSDVIQLLCDSSVSTGSVKSALKILNPKVTLNLLIPAVQQTAELIAPILDNHCDSTKSTATCFSSIAEAAILHGKYEAGVFLTNAAQSRSRWPEVRHRKGHIVKRIREKTKGNNLTM